MPNPDIHPLPFAAFEDVAALSARRSARWRPGLASRQGLALHNELFASSCDGAGGAAALALALDDWRNLPVEDVAETQDRRSILWVQTREAARRTGRPYRAGLPADMQVRIIYVLAEKAEDALFALEEGLRCRDLAFVVGEIAGNPKALDFTASRRLTLTGEKHGVPLFLVRIDAERDYVRLYVGDKTYLLLQTIAGLEERLDPEEFIRIHRSTILRKDHIAGLRHDGLGVWSVELEDGEMLRIGRTFLPKVKAMAGR